MKKSFLLTLLALFPLLMWGWNVDFTIQGNVGGDNSSSYQIYVGDQLPDVGTIVTYDADGCLVRNVAWSSWEKLDADNEWQAVNSFSSAAEGTFRAKVAFQFSTKTNGNIQESNWENADPQYVAGNVIVVAKPDDNPSTDQTDPANPITGNLKANAYAIQKFWGQKDPAPVWTITNASNVEIDPADIGLDPETASAGSNALGFDMGNYPTAKSLVLGVNLEF